MQKTIDFDGQIQKEPMAVFLNEEKSGKNANSINKNIMNEMNEQKTEQKDQSCSIEVGQSEENNAKNERINDGELGERGDVAQLLLNKKDFHLNGDAGGNGFRRERGRHEPFFGKFHFCIALLLALATYSCTSMRMNLSMAMVCMVNSTAVHIKENGGSSGNNESFPLQKILEEERCPKQHLTAQNEDPSKRMGYKGTLEWSTAEQARLFGATFYGSFFTIWFSGYLADRFGAKLLISLAIAVYSLVSLLSPLFVSIDYNVFFAARIFMGFGEGLVMPTIASASSRWFPPEKRSLLIAICTTGNQIAALSAYLLSSQLCTLDLFEGWPTIFYTFGLVGMLCLALWTIFSSNGPEESRWIGQKEKEMLTTSLGGQKCKKMTGPIPWRQMILSLPLYSGILCQANVTFCNIILQSYLPTFFKEVVQVNLKNNGLFSVIPFVGQISSKIVFGILADFLIKRKMLSATKTVKLFQGIANFGAAFAAICMGIFVDCRTPGLAAIFMSLWGISYGANTSGFFTQLIAIGPRFSGTISSFATAIGILSSGISPIVVSTVVRHGTLEEWRVIWFLLAACNLFCVIFFIIFASAKIQEWAAQNEKTDQAD